MIAVWKKISIRGKIIIVGVLIIALFASSVFLYFIPTIERSIIAKKKEKIKEHTEIATWTIANFYQDFKNGLLKEKQAKELAIAHVQRIRYGPEKKDYLWINDFHPRMIMHPYASDLNGKDLSHYKDRKGKLLFVEFVKTCQKYGFGYVNYYWQWKDDAKKIVPKISYVNEFRPWQWIIGTGIYIEDVKEEINALYQKATIVTLLIICMATLLLFVISGSITNPIKGLVSGLKNSDLNTQLQCPTFDEVGQMTFHFNEFVNKIKDIVINVRVASTQLATSSEEMSAASLSFADYAQQQNTSANDVTKTVKEITSEMDNVTQDIDKQFNSLNKLVERTEELSNLINNLDKEIQLTMQVISKISDKAKASEEVLNEMIFTMNKIGNSSHEVYTVILMITEISEQINLLSLNAAIEAARAGDAGRGFAVVADEISKLAEETAQSISKISKIITENDLEINKGVSKVESTFKTMSDIIEGVNSSSEMIKQISKKMREQVGTKETVNKEVQEVKEMSDGIRVTTKVQKAAVGEILDLILKINEGSESITSGSEEMVSSSEEVATMAEQLKNIVDYFKV